MILASFPFLFWHCGEDDTKPEIYPIEGIGLFDANGSPYGCHGDDCSDDWMWNGLSRRQLSVLSFPDNIVLKPQDLNGVAYRISGYPCPLSRNGDMALWMEMQEDLKLKVAAVDSLLQPYNTLSILASPGPGNRFQVHISESWFDAVPEKTAVRMLYGLFNYNGEIIASGYGDFAICPEGISSPNYLDCMPE